MMDIKFIRENTEIIKTAATNKNIKPEIIDELLRADELRREFISKFETLRAEQKKTQDREEGAKLKEKIKELEADEKYKGAEEKFNELMVLVPNIISPDTPIAKNEEGNKEVYAWGEPKKFSFEPKDHIQLGKDLDILELESGSKVGGFGG